MQQLELGQTSYSLFTTYLNSQLHQDQIICHYEMSLLVFEWYLGYQNHLLWKLDPGKFNGIY